MAALNSLDCELFGHSFNGSAPVSGWFVDQLFHGNSLGNCHEKLGNCYDTLGFTWGYHGDIFEDPIFSSMSFWALPNMFGHLRDPTAY